jgi:ADP-heptose:LPS heptosyltransferase
VKKGRVELFAGGVGVGPRLLRKHGWNIEIILNDRQMAFRRNYLDSAGIGRRPIVGVQPYSRDTYKDHPRIVHFIESLAEDYDILVFHHINNGLPSGKGIATTAGLSLSDSLALVSVLDAMVCVDSAFLHAAAAFDIPVLAMFGPTDGKLFTRHHRHATILTAEASFPCAPCWRNEDMPCQITNSVGVSPCVAAVSLQTTKTALSNCLGSVRRSSAS